MEVNYIVKYIGRDPFNHYHFATKDRTTYFMISCERCDKLRQSCDYYGQYSCFRILPNEVSLSKITNIHRVNYYIIGGHSCDHKFIGRGSYEPHDTEEMKRFFEKEAFRWVELKHRSIGEFYKFYKSHIEKLEWIDLLP